MVSPNNKINTVLIQVKIILPLLPLYIRPNRKVFAPNNIGTPIGLNASNKQCVKQPIKKPNK